MEKEDFKFIWMAAFEKDYLDSQKDLEPDDRDWPRKKFDFSGEYGKTTTGGNRSIRAEDIAILFELLCSFERPLTGNRVRVNPEFDPYVVDDTSGGGLNNERPVTDPPVRMDPDSVFHGDRTITIRSALETLYWSDGASGDRSYSCGDYPSNSGAFSPHVPRKYDPEDPEPMWVPARAYYGSGDPPSVEDGLLTAPAAGAESDWRNSPDHGGIGETRYASEMFGLLRVRRAYAYNVLMRVLTACSDPDFEANEDNIGDITVSWLRPVSWTTLVTDPVEAEWSYEDDDLPDTSEAKLRAGIANVVMPKTAEFKPIDPSYAETELWPSVTNDPETGHTPDLSAKVIDACHDALNGIRVHRIFPVAKNYADRDPEATGTWLDGYVGIRFGDGSETRTVSYAGGDKECELTYGEDTYKETCKSEEPKENSGEWTESIPRTVKTRCQLSFGRSSFESSYEGTFEYAYDRLVSNSASVVWKNPRREFRGSFEVTTSDGLPKCVSIDGISILFEAVAEYRLVVLSSSDYSVPYADSDKWKVKRVLFPVEVSVSKNAEGGYSGTIDLSGNLGKNADDFIPTGYQGTVTIEPYAAEVSYTVSEP